jgi:hypothetical protein
MIVHLEKGITYHLDTYCPSGCIEPRKLRIKKLVQIMLFTHLDFNGQVEMAIDNFNFFMAGPVAIPFDDECTLLSGIPQQMD